MNIKKLVIQFLLGASIVSFIPVLSFAEEGDSGINSGSHGLHLRGATGTGNIFWGYVNNANDSGDLGTGKGSTLNLAAMYNFTYIGFEFNYLYGDINDLEWTEEENGDKTKYKSTGSGYYNVLDYKLGSKLFTTAGDMGYTFIYMGKRYWNTKRAQDTVEIDGNKTNSDNTIKAKGDGWIYGIRDFSTIGADNSMAFVLQSGFFYGKAPVTKLSMNGDSQSLTEDGSFCFGGELGAGVASQDKGFSIIGGFRGEMTMTTFKNSVDAAVENDDSVFGFGNFMYFVEFGMMF